MFNGATNFYNLNNENFHNFLMEMYKKIDLLDKDTNYIRNHLIEELRKELKKIIANGELIVDIESVVDDFLKNGLAENKVVTDIKKKLEECSSQLDTHTSVLELLKGENDNSYFHYGIPHNKMKELYKDLINPYVQKLGLVLIGDSITWGMTVTGQGDPGNRNGTHTDLKNNMTSPSWANLLHQYIGESFFGQTVNDVNTSNYGTIIYNKSYNLGFNQNSNVKYSGIGTSTGLVDTKDVGTALVGKNYYLYPQSYIEFTIIGDEIELFYTATTNTQDYELLVDGVSAGTFSTANTNPTNKMSRKHTFKYGEHKIKIYHPGVSGQVRLEGVKINKKFIFKNCGNIGRSTDDWQKGNNNGLYDNAFSEYDRHCIIQLGTNDRSIDGWSCANSLDSTFTYLEKIVSDIKIDYPNIKPIMACANAVSQDESNRAFTMREVRQAVYAVSLYKDLPFIDNFNLTQGVDKSKILADGLHPNDYGHLIMAKNFIGNLF